MLLELLELDVFDSSASVCVNFPADAESTCVLLLLVDLLASSVLLLVVNLCKADLVVDLDLPLVPQAEGGQ